MTIKCYLQSCTSEEVVPLDCKQFTVGRCPKCNLVLNLLEISDNHSLIEETETQGEWSLTDISDSVGKNIGVFLNNKKLEKRQSHALKNGDIISFGFLFGSHRWVFITRADKDVPDEEIKLTEHVTDEDVPEIKFTDNEEEANFRKVMMKCSSPLEMELKRRICDLERQLKREREEQLKQTCQASKDNLVLFKEIETLKSKMRENKEGQPPLPDQQSTKPKTLNNSTIQTLQEKYSQLRKEKETLKSENEGRMREINDSRKESNDARSLALNFQRQFRECKDLIERRDCEVNRLNEINLQIKQRLKIIEEENISLKCRQQSLAEQLDEIDRTRAEQRNQILRLEGELAKKQKEEDGDVLLLNQIASKDEELEQLKREIANYIAINRNLKNDINDLARDREEGLVTIQRLKRAERAANHLDEEDDGTIRLLEQLSVKEEELDRMKRQLADSEANRRYYEEKIQKREDKICEMDDERNLLRVELTQLQERFDAQQGSHINAKNAYVEMLHNIQIIALNTDEEVSNDDQP